MTAQVCYLENALTPQNCFKLDVEPCSIQSLAPDWQLPFIAFVDGHPVLRADWELVIEDGQSLAFLDVNCIPQGDGGGGGSNPIAMILMIVVMVYAPYLAASLYTGMGGTLVMANAGMVIAGMTAAVGMVGMALVSALVPPPQPTSPQSAQAIAAASPTYNIQAQGNAARLEAAIPEHFGKMLAYPDFAAQPYQEYFGNDQYVYYLLCIGRGHYSFDKDLDVRVEDTPIHNFNDITTEVITPGMTPTSFPTNVVSSIEVSGQTLTCVAASYTQTGTVCTVTMTAHGLAIGESLHLNFISGAAVNGAYLVASTPTLNTFTVTRPTLSTSGEVNVSPYVGGFIANPATSVATKIGVDLVAPKGLYWANDNGSLGTVGIDLVVEARTVDDLGVATGAWVELSSGTDYTPWSGWISYVNPALQYVGVRYDSWGHSSQAVNVLVQGVPANAVLIEYTGGNPDSPGASYRTRALSTGVERMTGATTTPQRKSVAYTVLAGRYEVRLYRFDVESLSTRAGHSIAWAGLRSYLFEEKAATYAQSGTTVTVTRAAHGHTIGKWVNLTYQAGGAVSGGFQVATIPTTSTFTVKAAASLTAAGTAVIKPCFGDVTLLAVKMLASNSLSSQSSRKINVLCTRKLPLWNGTTWSANTATSKIAPAIAYACKQIGMKDSQIDLAALLTLDTVWASRGDEFNGRFDSFLSFWEAMVKLTGAGRTKPFVQGGVIRFMRDQAVTIPVALYSMRNIIKGSFKVDYLMPTADTADAVNVGYFDATNWTPARVQAKLADSTVERPIKVDIFGVTSRAQAFREGMYLAATNRYRRKVIKFDAEMDGFIPSFGDLIAIQHDMPAWGQGGEVVAYDSGTRTLTMSETPTWGAGTHYVGLRKRDGSVDGPFAVTAGAQANQVILATSPNFSLYVGGAEERTHYAFGWADTWRQLAKVIAIRPQSLYRVSIECINEDANVHSAETNAIVPTMVTSQLSGYSNRPVVKGLSALHPPFAPGKMVVSWQPAPWADSYLVEQSNDGVTWVSTGSTGTTSLLATALYGDATTVRVAAMGLSKGPWMLALITPTPPPSDAVTMTATLAKDGVTLNWVASTDPYFAEYEVRVGPDNWATSTLVATGRTTQMLLPPLTAGVYVWRVKKVDDTGQHSVNDVTCTATVTVPVAPAVTLAIAGFNEVISWTVPASTFAVDHFEVRYGTSWAAGTALASVKTNTFVHKSDYLGARTYWVSAIDVAGNIGTAGSCVSSITAPAAPAIVYSVAAVNEVISWGIPASLLGIDHYEIRYGSTWAGGTPLASVTTNDLVRKVDYAGSRTYWVSAVDSVGNFGTPASYTATVVVPGAPQAPATTYNGATVTLSWSAPVTGTLGIQGYEIRQGTIWSSAAPVTTLASLTLTVPANWLGGRQYMISAIDVAGSTGAAAAVSATTLIPVAITGLSSGYVGRMLSLSWATPAIAGGTMPIKSFEVRRGASWASGAVVAITADTKIQIEVDWPSTATFFVAAWDMNDNLGVTTATTTTTLSAPGSSALSGGVTGTSATFTWPAAAVNGLPIDRYELRYGASWAASTPAGTTQTLTLSVPVVWAGERTYWLAPIDTSGNVGTATSAVVTVSAHGVVGALAAAVTPSTVSADLSWAASTGSLPVDFYEVRYGGVFASAAVIGTTKSSAYSVPADWSGSRTFWVVTKDVNGTYGSESSALVTVTALGAPAVSSNIVAVKAELSWSVPTGSLPVREYEIRVGASWAAGVFFAKTTTTKYRVPVTWAGNQTFWVAAYDEAAVLGAQGSVTVTVSVPNTVVIDNANCGVGGGLLDQFRLAWVPAVVDGTRLPIDRYTVGYGAVTLDTINGTTYMAPANWAGDRAFWVQAVDVNGNAGAQSPKTLTITAPSAPTTLSLQVVDNNVLMYWNGATSTLPIDSYELAKEPTFNANAPSTYIGKKSGGFTTVFETISGTYTYYIRAIDTAGNPGTVKSQAGSVSQPPDYVLNIDWNSTFSGTKVNAALDADGSLLMPSNTAETWTTHFTSNGWTTPQNQIDALYPNYDMPSTGSGYYEQVFDYGSALPATKVSVTPTAVTYGSPVVSCDISTSLDNVTYTPYVGVWSVYATNFRYVKVRVTVTSGDGKSQYDMSGLNIKLDSKIRSDAGMRDCLSTDVGGTVVTFTGFVDVSSITLTPGGTTPVTALYDFVDAPGATSFKILLFNAAGTRVSGPCSWSIKGY